MCFCFIVCVVLEMNANGALLYVESRHIKMSIINIIMSLDIILTKTTMSRMALISLTLAGQELSLSVGCRSSLWPIARFVPHVHGTSKHTQTNIRAKMETIRS